MFKSGGVDSDLLEQNAAQILFYVDLENETIVQTLQSVKNDSDEEAQQNLHPVLLN